MQDAYCAKFVADSKAKIESHKSELAKYEAMIPFEEMTMEEFADAYPEHVCYI